MWKPKLTNAGTNLEDVAPLLLKPKLSLSGGSVSRCLVLCLSVLLFSLASSQSALAEMVPRTLSGHIYDVFSVVFSPDRRTLASGSNDGTVRVWDVGTGVCLRTLRGHNRCVDSVAFSPDGRTLASGSGGDKTATVRLWNVGEGSCIRTMRLNAKSYAVVRLAFSPDGLTLASTCGDDNLQLWDVSTGACVRTITSNYSEYEGFNSVAFAPDGTIAVGSGNNFVRLWDPGTGVCLRTLTGHSSGVWCVSFSADGRTLASGSGDKTVRLWDVNTGECMRTLSGHNGTVYSVAFSSDGRIVGSGSGDRTLRLWSTSTGTCLRTLGGNRDRVNSLAFSPDDRTLALTNLTTVKMWPLWRDEILCKYIPSSSNPRLTSASIAVTPRVKASEPVQPPVASAINARGTRPQFGTNRAVQDKWALVIGISKFANPAYNLKYAAKDAQDFYNYLITEGNFKKDHVLLLLDENATQRNIKAAFGRLFLPAVAKEGDLVAIYVSTHGTPASKDPGKRNYIVAYDTNAEALYETGIDMDDLSKRVKEGVDSDRVLIVMDTCYSGGGVPGARGVDACDNFDARQIAQGFGHLVISSSSPNERSWESKVSSNGVFTKYLLQNLRLTGGNVKNAFDKLKDDVGWEVQNAFNQKQHPQLGGEWAGKELILSAPATVSRPILNPELIKLINLQNASQSDGSNSVP